MKRFFSHPLVFTFLVINLVTVQLSSCEKTETNTTDNCPDPTYPITGLWEGTYTTDQVAHAATYVSFAIYPDGTFLRRSKVTGSSEYALFKGTWSLSGNNFQFRDTTLVYSGGLIIDEGYAVFNNTGTLTNATWEDKSGQPYTGAFQNMRRIN